MQIGKNSRCVDRTQCNGWVVSRETRLGTQPRIAPAMNGLASSSNVETNPLRELFTTASSKHSHGESLINSAGTGGAAFFSTPPSHHVERGPDSVRAGGVAGTALRAPPDCGTLAKKNSGSCAIELLNPSGRSSVSSPVLSCSPSPRRAVRRPRPEAPMFAQASGQRLRKYAFVSIGTVDPSSYKVA